MSTRQTSIPSPDQTPEGTQSETHWSEDADFQWRAATELLIALGVPRSTARLTGDLRDSMARLEAVDAGLPRDGEPLPEADRLARNNAVDDVARAILPLAHATLERIRAEELRTEVVGVDYDALCNAVAQLEATYRAGWWRSAEREGADFFLREVEALDRLNVPPVRATWRDAGRIVGVLRRMPDATLRRVAPTSNPIALRFMVLFALQAGYRDGLFDKTTSISRVIHTRTSEYRNGYRIGSTD